MRSNIPSRQLFDHANQPTYIWKEIDPRTSHLVRAKFRLAVQKTRKDIDKGTAQILSDNRLNLNRRGVEASVLQTFEDKIDDHAKRCYEILCNHWSLLGHKKTGTFVRVALKILLPNIGQIGESARHQAHLSHRRTGGIGRSLAQLYENSAKAICNLWSEKLDIEAGELDLGAASGESSARAQEAMATEKCTPETASTQTAALMKKSRIELGIPNTPRETGICRAMSVEKIRREMVEIGQALELPEDYNSKIRGNRAFVDFTTVSVCNRHADLADKLCAIKTTRKPRIVEIASEIAARSYDNTNVKPILPRTFQSAHKRFGAPARVRLNRRK
jgi:hypothetical protein